jgi:hypothetical protein
MKAPTWLELTPPAVLQHPPLEGSVARQAREVRRIQAAEGA